MPQCTPIQHKNKGKKLELKNFLMVKKPEAGPLVGIQKSLLP
jgi:hypothetical protein